MKKGFTLIEAIITVAMVSLLILAISGLTSMSIRTNIKASKRDESFNIARGICEIYKANTDNYSVAETEISIYKYINSLLDIQSINEIIRSKDGDYLEEDYDEVVNGNNGLKYTLILKIKRITSMEEMEIIYVEIVRNDGEQFKISFNAAK